MQVGQEATVLHGLARILHQVDAFPLFGASSQYRQRACCRLGVVAAGTAMHVAGVFLRARICGTDQRQPQHRHAPEMAGQVALLDVAQLVAKVEVDAIGLLAHGVQRVGEHNDEVAAQKARGKRVHDAVALQDVDLWRLHHAQLLAALQVLQVQIGELLVRQPHASAAQPGDEA
ncbi:hypothetical protein D3C72_1723210 [compost metagenome]